MDRQEMEVRLERVAAYRASGQKAKAWAEANGVPLGTLGGWCAHSRRWQARLEGARLEPTPKPTRVPRGFVAACVEPRAVPISVRIELSAGSARLELHWPLAHTHELAALLQELGR